MDEDDKMSMGLMSPQVLAELDANNVRTTELFMLRSFFESWEEFHAKAASGLPRKTIEVYAQSMTDWANTYRNYRDSVRPKPQLAVDNTKEADDAPI